ncbi:MAG: hypothetical protein K2X52_14950 [Mycobacteriaceae bacterium]|jgi:hypothetical protein|nr:hypothetical protein [Mycobacteriaceae bacterium]
MARGDTRTGVVEFLFSSSSRVTMDRILPHGGAGVGCCLMLLVPGAGKTLSAAS